MRLYVVSSIYQFINAITIESERKKNNSDILLIKPVLKDCFDLDKLQKTKIFHKVYYWFAGMEKFCIQSKNKKDFIKNNIQKILFAFEQKKLKNALPNIEKVYDEICVFYPDYVSRLVCFFLSKYNTRIIFVEDGTYTYGCFGFKEHYIKRIAYKILLGQNIQEKCSEIYVYRPEFVKIKNKKIILHSIHSNLEFVRKIMAEINKNPPDEIKSFDRSFLMFDQNLEYEEILLNQARVATEIVNRTGYDNFLVKMHPGSTISLYEKRIMQYKSKLPFEILMTTMDLENKILICIFSTACMNPKFLLNAEPTIIFTYKLVGLEKLDFFKSNYLKIIEDLKFLYKDKTKIIIPETYEELKSAIDRHIDRCCAKGKGI